MARPPRLKVYSAIADGVFRYLVAAPSRPAAAALIGCTAHTLREYGGVVPPGPAADLALAHPGVVWRQRAAVYPEPPWERDPHQAARPGSPPPA